MRYRKQEGNKRTFLFCIKDKKSILASFSQKVDVGVIKFLVPSLIKRIAYLLHKIVIEV